jgi:hypothetical protein
MSLQVIQALIDEGAKLSDMQINPILAAITNTKEVKFGKLDRRLGEFLV